MTVSIPQPHAGPSGHAETSGRRLLALTVAVASGGAGLLHLAYAPDHLASSGTHGAFFLAVAWIQIAFALAVAFGRAPRPALIGAMFFNAAVIGVWLVSRTAGIDGPAEAVGAPDLLACIFELTVIGGCGLLAADWMGPRVSERSYALWAGVSTLGVITLVSAAAVPSVGGGHVHAHSHTEALVASHDHSGHTHATGADGGHKHDQSVEVLAAGKVHQHNHDGTDTTSDTSSSSSSTHSHSSSSTASGSTDGHNHDPGTAPTDPGHVHDPGTTPPPGHDHPPQVTPDAWEKLRRAALMGGLDAASINAKNAVVMDYLNTQLRNRSGLLTSLPEAQRATRIQTYSAWQLAHSLDSEHGGNHTHGPAEWIPMTPSSFSTLQGELKVSAGLAAKYPTADAATRAGYFQVTPWYPGIGAHYLNIGNLSAFDPGKPAMLLYNGNGPGSELVGVSFAVLANSVPAGFTGPNDVWHEHPALCIVGGSFVVGADATPADLCASVGGVKGNGFGSQIHLFMMHVWQVPGWESSWGLFSGENPAVNYAATDIGR